jgi:hypothetical protein
MTIRRPGGTARVADDVRVPRDRRAFGWRDRADQGAMGPGPKQTSA